MNVSVPDRTDSEQRAHRRANAILVAILVSVVSLAVAYQKLPLHLALTGRAGYQQPSPSDEALGDDQQADTQNQVHQLRLKLEAVRRQLPSVGHSDDIRAALDRMEKHLVDTPPAPGSPTARTIVKQLEMMLEPAPSGSNRNTDNAAQFAAQFRAKLSAMQQREQKLTSAAIRDHVKAVETIWSDKLRDAELTLRDRRDETIQLQQQISRLQREQTITQQRAQRAAAMRSDLPDIEKYLAPFTAPGHLQPVSDHNPWHTKRTATAMPVSLAALKRLGALESTMDGYERLYKFGGGKNAIHRNERPLGSFPEYFAQHIDKPHIREAVRRAQELLTEHGQALVESRRLSP